MSEPRQALLLPAGIIHAAFEDEEGRLNIVWHPKVWDVLDFVFPPGVELVELTEETHYLSQDPRPWLWGFLD